MKRLFLIAALLLSSSANAIIINGALTTSDFLATDSLVKTFYYDVYNISNSGAAAITVDVTYDAGGSMSPWMAYWSSTVLPAANYESPDDLYLSALNVVAGGPGASISFPSFTLDAGALYQLSIATADYNEDGAVLSSYTLDISGATLRVDPITSTPVPEPGTLALLALGLFGVHRFKMGRS